MKDDSTVGGRAALVEAFERACVAYSNALAAEQDTEAAERANPSTDVHTPLHKAIDATREARLAANRAREALEAWDREHAAALDLDAIEARVNAATAGPWRECLAEQGGCQCCTIWSTPCDIPVADTKTAIAYEGKVAPEATMRADARFIAATRSDVPALCAEVRRLRAELANAVAIAPISFDNATMDAAWGRALDLIRADGLDPEAVIAAAAETVKAWKMGPPGAGAPTSSARGGARRR